MKGHIREEAIGHAHEIKIYALRKLGEMLKGTERAKAGRDSLAKQMTPARHRRLKSLKQAWKCSP